jgi:probable rRNA maturation factor
MAITLSAPRGLGRLAPALRALVRGAIAGEGARVGEVGIVLAGDAELRALNRRWRRIDRATDVLSFAYHGSAARAISGDLVISMDRVAAQARRYRVTRGRELARLAVHGALHLAGLDHARPAERRDMRRREDQVLRAAAAAVRALDRRLAAEPAR